MTYAERPSEPHPDRDHSLHERFTLRKSRSCPYAAGHRLGPHRRAVVAIADDVVQMLVRQIEEFHRVPVSCLRPPEFRLLGQHTMDARHASKA